MRYRGIEVNDHAEPVKVEDLKVGGVYFSVQFLDSGLKVPIIETLIFLGENLDPGCKGLFYFQQAESFERGVRFKSSRKKNMRDFQVARRDGMNHIFDFDHAVDILLMCGAQRAT
jgi:hypothetical protein